jgi:predicted HTH transcriptional regulator
MSPADLERMVRIGEGYHLEFKQRVSSPGRIAREAIAFANTWGGTILVGVDDDGRITGLKDSEEELFDLRTAFKEYCDPPIQLLFEVVPVSRKRDVIVVRVDRSETKPHTYREPDSTISGEILIRVEDNTIVASAEMAELLRLEKSVDGVAFEFGQKELFLLRYLDEYESVDVGRFATLAGITHEDASSTLVVLVRARVVDLVPSDKGDRFVLNRRAHQASGT